jgi:hypothetical protein
MGMQCVSGVNEITAMNFLQGLMSRSNRPSELNDLQSLRGSVFRYRSELTLRFKNAHFSPALPKSPNADGWSIGCAANIFDVQQFILTTKRKEVRKERVEVWFGTQMKDLRVMRIVYMREDAQELTIDVLDG